MSGSISFNSIPPNIRIPLFWVEVDNSQAGVNQDTQRTVILGESTNTVALAPMLMPSKEVAKNVYGTGSMIARMVEAYRANDPFGELWAIGLPAPGAGAAATRTVTIGGTATAAGTLTLYIGGQRVQVAVASGDAATAVATALNVAVNAADDLPVSSGVASAVVTLTSLMHNTMAASLDVRANYYGALGQEVLPAGITVTIGAVAGGTGSPDLTGIPALLANDDYDFIVSGYSDSASLTALQAMMNDSAGRWSWLSQRWGHVFTAKVDSAANLLTAGAARNDQHTTIFGATALPTPPWEFAAAMAGACIPALKADPARPLQTLGVNGVLAPAVSDRHSLTVQQSMLTTGIALASYSRAGDVTVERAVTTYQLNKFGQADQSYLDVETMFTLMAVMRRLRSTVTQKLPRSKLADDGTRIGFGQPVVTPKIIRGLLIAEYASMEWDGLVDETDLFARGLVVVRNDQDPSRVDVLFDPYLISGLRIFAVLNQFRLQAQANSTPLAA